MLDRRAAESLAASSIKKVRVMCSAFELLHATRALASLER